MRISRRAEYAVRAVLDLALHARPGLGIRSADIARRTSVPEKFLEAILLELRKAGLVSSRRGPDGGHRLARDPPQLTVRAILEAIDGPLAARDPHATTPAEACLQSLWREVEAATQAVLESVTIEDLRRRSAPGDGVDFSI
jgi:Rrf2 family transcriptional regulator, cysteine metabolism repressor